jgi:hypothetical protein
MKLDIYKWIGGHHSDVLQHNGTLVFIYKIFQPPDWRLPFTLYFINLNEMKKGLISFYNPENYFEPVK